jgi:hypothetical protein
MKTFENFKEESIIVEDSFIIFEVHKKFNGVTDNTLEFMVKKMARKYLRIRGETIYCKDIVIKMTGIMNQDNTYMKNLNFAYVDKDSNEHGLPVREKIEVLRITSSVDPYGEEDWE